MFRHELVNLEDVACMVRECMDVSDELLIKNLSINILFSGNKESGITDRCQIVCKT